MRIFTLAASCAAIGFFVPSCDEDTPGRPDTSSTGADADSAAAIIDNFCKAIVAPLCEGHVACCGISAAPPFSTLDLCKQGVIDLANPVPFCWLDTQRKRLKADLQAGTVVFDQAQFDTCLSTLKALSAGGTACTESAMALADTICLSAFRGQIAPGEACTRDERNFFQNVISCKGGRCEDDKCVPFLKTGDSCDPRNPIGVAANTICNYVREEGCRIPPPPDAGGAGDGGGAELTGTCGPQGDIGDTCYGGNAAPGWRECKSSTCDATATCVLPHPLGFACAGP